MISKGGRYISASMLDLDEASDAPPVACDNCSWWVEELPFQMDAESCWLKMPGRPTRC